MGNGLPISSISGTSEYMKIFDKLWVSTTNSSEALSLAGTAATIREMKNKNSVFIAGFTNTLPIFLWRLLPRKLCTKIVRSFQESTK